MKLLKILLLMSVLGTSSIACAGIKVTRILEPVPYLLDNTTNFKIWREVCVESPITVKVFKKFKNRHTGKIYRPPSPAEYEFKSGKCEVGIYTVGTVQGMPSGVYDYLPRMVYTEGGKTIIEEIPNEIIIIK